MPKIIKIAPAVAEVIPRITQAVELITTRLKAGGRLFYVGAGTSGRLGILDVAEIRPTFGIGLDTVEAIINGGSQSYHRSGRGGRRRFSSRQQGTETPKH